MESRYYIITVHDKVMGYARIETDVYIFDSDRHERILKMLMYDKYGNEFSFYHGDDCSFCICANWSFREIAFNEHTMERISNNLLFEMTARYGFSRFPDNLYKQW